MSQPSLVALLLAALAPKTHTSSNFLRARPVESHLRQVWASSPPPWRQEGHTASKYPLQE